ncbi:MAG: calcium-transporting P-type ATPase, PMR1-type [Clostridia bacterium]|nr:calcium-transporting P-type ATPase, PMR1-type [Clostridia bacterium]
MKNRPWHRLESQEVVEILKSDLRKGLSSEEAGKRLKIYGPNQLQEPQAVSPLKILLSQFSDFMVLVLIGATLISGLLGEYADAITILAIVVVNALLGFVQEYRAEKSMEALKKLTAPEATVLRGGSEIKIPAREVVPGDILLLNAGDKVAADLRLLEAINLEIEEALLTGESYPIVKVSDVLLKEDVPVGDRRNMAHLGTAVTRGRGMGIVVATGMETEMGRIAELMETVETEDTPLQKRLAQLGSWLVLSCLLICGLVAVTGMLRGEPIYQMFLAGVSLAVAAIPEGLPAIVTVALAIGVQKMVRRKSIVRKLPAVETLGCATVICSDKTGTLTQNEMTVKQVYCDDRFLSVTGDGYEPRGQFLDERGQEANVKGTALAQVLKAAALCNNSNLVRDGISLGGLFRNTAGKKEIKWTIAGDPTEGALLTMAAKANFWREVLERKEPRVGEIPFDSERKMMTVITRQNSGLMVYTKGAPDVILGLCNQVLIDGKVVTLTEDGRQQLLSVNETMAAQALRVIALAYKPVEGKVQVERDEAVEQGLIFLGLVGMKDPPRPQAVRALRICREAGIQPVMITGDHQVTAEAIAREMGFPLQDKGVLTGVELDEMSDEELAAQVENVSVYARVSPKHKLRIVKAWKKRGHVVAMTGDGVNDAPAVKEADIGIAMGKTGTDVTKEASSMVLADDDFATIVAAVEEGRAIYDNIRKFIRYLLSSNIGEVLTMFLAALMGVPLPLLPIQILWVNLVTDGLPAMALSVDQADPDIMKRPPRHPKESVFSDGLAGKILWRGCHIGIGTLLVFLLAYYLSDGNLVLSRTMAFTTLVFFQLFHVFDCRSERHSPFELGFLSNLHLVLAVALSVAMQLAVIYLPACQSVFKTTGLNGLHWLIILAVAGGRTILAGLYHLFVVSSGNTRKPVYQ